MTGRSPRLPVGLLATLVAALSAASPLRGLDFPLVVARLPAGAPAPGTPVPNQAGLPVAQPTPLDGAQLVVVSPDGAVRPLTTGFHSAADPDVSFDGQRVLFAGQQEPGGRWRIWETGLDGQGLRAVTPESLDARQPLHVSTLFTLDSPQPWYTLVFVARESTRNEAGQPGVFSLYNLKLDGGELRRVTYNPNASLDPFQHWDGRLLYAAERHPLEPGGGPPRVGLHAVHIEGADTEFHGGGRGQRIQRTPCSTDQGLIVFIESDQPAPDGSGQLACVEEARPHVTHRVLTRDSAFVYREPAPLPGGRVLVSRRPVTVPGTWGMGVFDPAAGTWEPVADSPDHHEVQAVPAVPRRSPDGHSTVVETRFDTGIFYGLNCYDADPRLAAHLRTGMVHRVRFIEGLPPSGQPAPASGPAEPLPVARRLIGEAPVESDGSFNVEVPADIPLLLQTLDDRGMALATCGWVWVKPREKRGCIGCHEDPERIPENHYVLALQRPSNRLVLPPAQRRSVTFRQDIAPILQSHCANTDCHGSDGNALHLPLAGPAPAEADFRTAYERLLAAAPGPASDRSGPPPGRYVDAGRARTSRLAWHLTGTRTTRPWDAAPSLPSTDPIPLMPPPDHGRPLSPEQRRTLIQWMDLGAPYAAPVTAVHTNAVTQP